MTERFHVFEGDLYRDGRVFRQKHTYSFRDIETASQFKATLRNGAFAWPGGYPLYFITSDGAALCFDCGKSEAKLILQSIKDYARDGWHVEACTVNWEDAELTCDHCDKEIESAYGEKESA
jgi:hypothetical protein